MAAADRRQEGPFAALDDYDVRHVVTHLFHAGRDQDVHSLLCLEDGEHRNGWFAERERRGDVAGFLDDVAQARTAASQAVADAIMSGRAAAALPLELRYALVTSSVNSLSRNLPPSLLAALAGDGAWTMAQALRYAAQQPFAPLRAEAFALLAPQCTQSVARDCLRLARAAAQAIRARPDWRVRALGQVAANAPLDMRRDVIAEALGVLREVGSIEADENVATLMTAAPAEMRDELEAVFASLPVSAAKPVRPGVDGLDGRPNPWTYGVRRFAELLPGLSEPVRVAIIDGFRDGEGEAVYRGIVVAACAGQDPALAGEALDIAGTIPEAPLRAEVIATVSPHLDGAGRARLLGELLAEARQSGDPATTAQVLTAVMPVLPEADREAAVNAALSATRTVENATLRSYLLRFLVPFVPAGRLADVVAETGRLGGGAQSGDRGRVIAALAPRVPRSLLPDLLRLCQQIGAGLATWTVVQLAEASPEDDRREIMARALSWIAAATGPGRMERLEYFIPQLDIEQFMLASAVADRLEEDGRVRALRCLAGHATDDARVELVERDADPATAIRAWLTRSETADPGQRSELLAAAWAASAGIEDLDARLALSVEVLGTGEQYPDAEDRARDLLAAVKESGQPTAGRVRAIASLMPFLPAGERPGEVDYALALIRADMDEKGPLFDEVVKIMRPLQWIPYEAGLTWALTSLFPHLTARHYAVALRLIGDIRQENERAGALFSFAEHAPGAVTVPSEYFDIAGTFTALPWWARVHCAALPLLPAGEQRQRLIDVLLGQLAWQPASLNVMGSGELWKAVIPYLSDADLRTALDIATAVQDAWTRDYFLTHLVPHLDETNAVAVVFGIEAPLWKVRAFTALAERGISPCHHPEFLAVVSQMGADTELLPIAALLPAEQCHAVLHAAALELMGRTFTWDPPEPLAEYLASASPARLCALWQQTAPALAGQGRDAVINRIRDLDQFMYRVAGEHAALDIATAILDVLRWWP